MNKNALPILYSFRRCPYAIRARLALSFAKIRYALREVDLAHKPQEMLTISPKGTVPVLQFPDQRVLEESMDIVHWALSENYPIDWVRMSLSQQHAANQLIVSLHDEFIPALNRFKYPDRYVKVDEQAQRELLMRFFNAIDLRLHKHKFVFGDAPCYLDICIFPFVRQSWIADKQWFESMPNQWLINWFDYWLQHSVFTQTMQKTPFWIA